ncbi:MAG: SAM-dependent methyltransferase, partial [Planctomycetia bacterium]|nr:SAM-dependent methyltransferase [Planctomycetia bacterium]
LRTVMGIRGEPTTPDDPARGLVWSAIIAQMDQPGSQSDFVSVGDSERLLFHKHPWSIGGGGASELKELLEEGATQRLDALTQSIGFASFTGTDEAFLLAPTVLERLRVSSGMIRPTILGDNVRDWCIDTDLEALAPYDANFDSYSYAADAPWGRYLWLFRNTLGSVISFGGRTRLECGDQWWTWYRWVKEKYRTPLSIVFGEVATHNHFVLDRGGKVFKQTAPVIKLPCEASEDDHLAILGLLNSSSACFWMKQVCFPKGGDHVGQEGARVRRTAWDERFAFNGTNLEKFPLPADRPLLTARLLDSLATRARDFQPASIASCGAPTRAALDTAK